MQSNRILHTLLVGMQNDAATFENSLAVSLKFNIHLPHDIHLSNSWVFTQEEWKPHSKTSPKLGATQISISWWMEKQTYIRIMGILLNNKKEQTTDVYSNMNGFQKYHVKWKEPDTKSYMSNDSIYVTLWKRQNYRDRNQISGCPRYRRGLTSEKQNIPENFSEHWRCSM